jgi:hypothetical protein
MAAIDEQALEWARYTVFVRKAREAAHQSLYFLYHLDDRGKAHADPAYVAFALQQAHALVAGVHIPSAFKDKPPEAPEKARTGRLTPIEIVELWRERIRKPLRALADAAQRDTAAALPTTQFEELRSAVQEFLEHSTLARAAVSTHDIVNLQRFLKKNLSLLVALAFALIVCFFVEAFNSLLRNEGWYAIGIAAVVLSSWVALFASNRASVLGLGHRAFWAYRYMALEPARYLERWPRQSNLPTRILWAHAFKTMLLISWLSVAAVVIGWFGESTRLTVFLGLALLLFIATAGHWLDRWEFLDPRPIRLIGLAGVIATVVLLLFEQRLASTALLLAAVGYTGFRLFERRTASSTVPVLCVGLFAVFNNVSSHRLAQQPWRRPPPAAEAAGAPGVRVSPADWPFADRMADGMPTPVVVVTASGGGSRAAIFTALALQRLNQAPYTEIGRNVQAISSVSGGSLGSATYIARLFETYRSRQPRADRLAPIVRAVSQDFLLPTLRGALLPGTTRAEQIEGAWRAAKGPALGDIRLSSLTARWREAQQRGDDAPPFPMPLFNTTSLDQHDVVISPLPSSFYCSTKPGNISWARQRYPIAERDELTWVYDRDAIYGLDALLGDFDPDLAQAVRASANFPFGFPLVELESTMDLLTWHPHFAGAGNTALPASTASLKLTDGGVLSNSGLWPVHDLLTSQPDRLSELRKRGVLIVVIEASKMPEFKTDRHDLDTLYGAIGNRVPVAQAYHRKVFELLNLKLGGRLAIVQLDMIPKSREPSYNVHTTWALDEASKAKVKESVALAFKQLEEPEPCTPHSARRGRLECLWSRLRAGEAPGAIDIRRPPVD